MVSGIIHNYLFYDLNHSINILFIFYYFYGVVDFINLYNYLTE
jgi:hypothetical protein